jgi:predicted metal-dependent phosphoesterase TrpH
MTVTTEFDLHVHSRYSFDSPSKPEDAVKRAARLRLRGLSVNDHNSLRGGLAAARFAKKSKLELVVVPGEEVKTSAGDVLGLFLNEEILTRDAFEAIDLIKQQGGLAVFPHPYRSHDPLLIGKIARRVDVIETANSRSYFGGNGRARELARGLRKPECGGSDAHLLCEIGLARTLFSKEIGDVEELRKALKGGLAEARVLGVNPFARLATRLYSKFKKLL